MVSKEIMENIDLEEGKIRVNDDWLTEDEIRYAIKMKVSSDDYNVADLASALKTLITEMNKSTVLKIRLPKEMAEEFEKLSNNEGETVESMLRNLIMEYINSEEEESEIVEAEGEEADSYDDVEIERPKEFVKGVIVDEEEEDDVDVGVNEDSDENIDINFKDDEEDDDFLEIEDSDSVKVESEGELEVEDISDIDDEIEEEEVKEFKKLPKKKKVAKKKSTMRLKKLRQKRR